jgi:hypothetical protein
LKKKSIVQLSTLIEVKYNTKIKMQNLSRKTIERLTNPSTSIFAILTQIGFHLVQPQLNSSTKGKNNI